MSESSRPCGKATTADTAPLVDSRSHPSKIRRTIPVAPPWRDRLTSRRCNIWRLSQLTFGRYDIFT
jgi:hypothetical protein